MTSAFSLEVFNFSPTSPSCVAVLCSIIRPRFLWPIITVSLIKWRPCSLDRSWSARRAFSRMRYQSGHVCVFVFGFFLFLYLRGCTLVKVRSSNCAFGRALPSGPSKARSKSDKPKIITGQYVKNKIFFVYFLFYFLTELNDGASPLLKSTGSYLKSEIRVYHQSMQSDK